MPTSTTTTTTYYYLPTTNPNPSPDPNPNPNQEQQDQQERARDSAAAAAAAAASAGAALLPAAAAAAARRDEADGWEQIGAARGTSGKRKDKPSAAAPGERGERAAAPAEAAQRKAAPAPKAAVVLFRCDGCGAMNTLIEEDPDEEGVGYCRTCWRKWEVAATEAAPEAAKAQVPFRTRWDGS